MDYQKHTHEFYRRQRIRRRKNRNRTVVFFIFLGAIAFYFFVLSTSKIQTPPPQQGSGLNQNNLLSSTDPVSQPASSAPEQKEESPIENKISLSEAAKPIWIKVNIPEQTVVVYDAHDKVVQNFICSTGKEGSDTPVGTYTVKQRGQSFFSKQYQEGAYYWTQFQGDFLFHSVPFDKNKKIEPEEAAKLGSKASHGCVRLALEDAKWIYENIPKGTKVVIE